MKEACYYEYRFSVNQARGRQHHCDFLVRGVQGVSSGLGTWVIQKYMSY